MKIYKNKKFLNFDLGNGKTVQYDFATKKAIGKSGKPVKDLKSQLRSDKMIYLDASATTKVKPEVLEAMTPYFTDKWQNPSSLYRSASAIKNDIEKARNTVGGFIGANSKEIYFTSGGSESNCWAIQGFVHHWRAKGCGVSVVTSTIEHKSILSCANALYDAKVYAVGVDGEGFLKMEALENRLQHIRDKNPRDKILVSVQNSNNEIGTVQKTAEISRLVHRYGAVSHSDAVQSFGHIPVNVAELGVDMLSASGHKIGCPKGIGFLYIKDGIEIAPLIHGSQMDGLRGGTENVPYIMGMAKAVELLSEAPGTAVALDCLRNHMMLELQSLGCTINGSIDNRLPNNISVTFAQDITGEAMVYLLDACGIEISTGSACNAHFNEPSHVLKAIGLSDEQCAKTIRITLPSDITMKQIDMTVQEIAKQTLLLSKHFAPIEAQCGELPYPRGAP